MKTFRFLVVFGAFMMLAGVILAQTTTLPVAVTGTAEQGVIRSFGGEVIGGFSGGTSLGQFDASGMRFASGFADANGKAVGFFETTPSSALSMAKAIVDSSAKADGNIGGVLG